MGFSETKIRRYTKDTPDMPAALRRAISAGGETPVAFLGDPRILRGRLIGFFCSIRCPGDPILKTYDLARALRDTYVTIVGGYQSPMEKELLYLLLPGPARLVVCPARGLGRMRILKIWNPALDDGRLAILSFFDDQVHRPTVPAATERNVRVAALADTLLIAHAEAGGKIEALCREAIRDGKPVFALASTDNAHLFEIGARPVEADNPVDLIGVPSRMVTGANGKAKG